MSFLFLITGILLILFLVVFLFFQLNDPLTKEDIALVKKVQKTPVQDFITGATGHADNKGVKIYYESIGKKDLQHQETIILINGLSQILLDWPKYFYQPLIEAGYHVIRFDNRGVGLSDWIRDWGEGNRYTLEDMATDVIAILDQLNIHKAHLVGMSMGGMIAQRLAISHAQRVLSLTSIMSSGYFYDPELTNLPNDFYRKAIAISLKYPGNSKSEATRLKLNLAFRLIQDGQGDYRLDAEAVLERAKYELRQRRGYNLKSADQHGYAIKKSGSRYEELGQIQVPALVIHGTTDPLIKWEHAKKYAPMIPHASTLFIEGMGHDLPPIYTPQMITAILEHLKKECRVVTPT